MFSFECHKFHFDVFRSTLKWNFYFMFAKILLFAGSFGAALTLICETTQINVGLDVIREKNIKIIRVMKFSAKKCFAKFSHYSKAPPENIVSWESMPS